MDRNEDARRCRGRERSEGSRARGGIKRNRTVEARRQGKRPKADAPMHYWQAAGAEQQPREQHTRDSTNRLAGAHVHGEHGALERHRAKRERDAGEGRAQEQGSGRRELRRQGDNKRAVRPDQSASSADKRKQAWTTQEEGSDAGVAHKRNRENTMQEEQRTGRLLKIRPGIDKLSGADGWPCNRPVS